MDTTVTLCVVLLASVCASVSGSFGFGENRDRILLRDIQVLTLKTGQMTAAGRSHPIPQLKCVGGTAGCSSFMPQVVQCYNRGTDGFDVQWECKTDMDNAYRLGKVEVSCEGYEYPDDPYILRGSCGLEYTLDLTKEGYQKQHSHEHDYYGDQQHHQHSSGGYHHDGSYRKKHSSWGGDLITLAVVGVIIYAIYKTCLSGSGDRGQSEEHRGDQGWRSGSRSQPPPPGFRSDYMPGSDDCSSGRSQSHTYSSRAPGASSTGGGFWTGAATGGLLGYMFGGRNNYNNYPGSYTTHSPYARRGWGSGWGGSTWGGGSGGGLGSSWGSSGRSSGGGSSMFSSGTRTASGFGGTKRR